MNLNFLDICGATDSETDMTKLTAALRNFANAPKNAATYVSA